MREGTSHDGPRLTLGVMARAPVAGRCKTRLGAEIGADVAARLYEAMLLDTLELLEGASAERLVVLAAPEDDGAAILRKLAPPRWEIVVQRGAGLGERLANAFRDLGPRAGELVCLLDSDSPTLPRHALAALRRPRAQGTVVVGPCDDGGYYLIGMDVLELGVLEGIPWSTPEVLAATRRRCAELALPLEELATWYDIDAARDLERLRAELATAPEAAPRTAALITSLDAAREAFG